MSRDSLLPRSLFSASTLKLEPTEDSLPSLTAQNKRTRDSLPLRTRTKKKIRISESEQEDEEDEDESIGSNANTHDPTADRTSDHSISSNSFVNVGSHSESSSNSTSSSSSSSSSSSEEEEDDDLPTTASTTAQTAGEIHHNITKLMIKLERQQARQNKYLEKVKLLNKAVKKTNRMIVNQANLLVKSSQPASPVEQPQLAKRTVPFEQQPRSSKQRRNSEEGSPTFKSSSSSSTNQAKPTPTKSAPSKPARPLFPFHRVNRTPRRTVEIDFEKRDKIDVYTVRRKQQENMSLKKPRSLLYNICDATMDRGLSDLMITTSLDGELHFWNAKERRKIKTIGQDHLYDSWIDDICWATPSTLAFCPAQKLNEPVKLVHIGNVTKNNVEGRVQTLTAEPHENGISVIASLDTGSYASRNSETCSFVTGGYDKSVYLWSLKRESPVDNFTPNGVHRLNIKHTAAVYSLCYDKFKNVLLSGGSDERLVIYDIQSNTSIRELRLPQRVSQIIQSKANPNIMLLTTTNRADQFCIYDQRVPGYEGIKLRFGQMEEETLSRFIRPDMHENGYMVCCGAQGSSRLNFWDLRYQGVSRSTSFGLDTQAVTRTLRSMFLPNQDAIVSLSSSRYITWLDYTVKKDEIVKSLT